MHKRATVQTFLTTLAFSNPVANSLEKSVLVPTRCPLPFGCLFQCAAGKFELYCYFFILFRHQMAVLNDSLWLPE